MDSLILSRGGNWNATAVRYWPLQCGPGQTASTVVGNAESVMPCDGSLAKLLGAAGTALAGGTSVTLTVMKNGVATALEVVLDSTNQILRDTTNTVTFVKGDRIAVRSTPSGSPSGQQPVFCCEVTAADGQPIITGEGAAITAAAVSYFGLQGSTVSVDADDATVIPTAGTIKKLQLRVGAAPGASKDWTVVLVKNGVDTTLTATISGAAATTAEDVTHDISVAEGDLVYWRATPTGTPANAILKIAAVFTPTTSGESIYTLSLTGSVLVTSGNRFGNPWGGDGNSWSSTEAAVLTNIPADGYTATKLRTVLQVAPTPGTRTITLRKAGASTALTFTVSGASTTGSDTDAGISYSANDSIAVLAATASSPPTTIATVSFVLSKATGTTVAVGQATTTNTAQPITARKTKAVGQATETDTARAFTTSPNFAGKRIQIDPSGGQSNERGSGSQVTAPNVADGDGYMWNGTAYVPLDEPVHGFFEDSATGSMHPAFCNAFSAAAPADMVPFIVQVAKGGTAQAAAAEQGTNGHWDDAPGELFDQALAEIEAAFAAATASYPLAIVEYGVFLWCQGERDAKEIDLGNITKAIYKAALVTMIAKWRAALGADLRFLLSQTGHPEDGDTTGFQQVREAQQEVADDDPLTFLAFTGAKDFTAAGKANGEHYTQAGYDDMGTGMGSFAASGPVALAAATETDTARPITVRKTVPVGMATATETARPVTGSKAAATGRASETDTANPITARKTYPVGQATTTDEALSIARAGVVGMASETDTARPVTALKTVPVGRASETDEAMLVTFARSTAVGMAAETDTALPITALKTRTVGMVTETDGALAMRVAGREVEPLRATITVRTAVPLTVTVD